MLFEIIALIALLMLSGFFSGAETACMSVSRIQAQAMVKQKKKGAETLLKLKEQPRRLIITILIGNNIVNIGASALATVIASDYFGHAGAGIATGIMTFLVLVFGEITPKSYATVHNKKIALQIAGPIMFISKVLHPLVLFFEYMTTHIIRLFGSTKKTQIFSETELRTLVEVGVSEKILEKAEKEFIEGVLEFNDITVGKVMTPKNRMFCLKENISVDKAIKEINKREHSRVPVYRGNKDNIIGFLYIKDLLKITSEKKNRMKIKNVIRKPLYVSQTSVISDVFRKFQTRHIHLGIVINKKHEVKGIVTMEDVIEEIVGEILDETDISPELMKKINKKTIIVHGETEIEDINNFFNTGIPALHNDDELNDFLTSVHKTKFVEGMKINYKNLKFIIKHVEDNLPVTVIVEKN